MKRSHVLIFAVAIALLLILLVDSYGRDILVRSGVLAGSEYLSLWERYKFTKHAEEGDIQSAKRMAAYYGYWKNSPKNMMIWVHRSAELGDKVDQYNYGIYLIEKEHKENDGLVWINRSAESGYERAKEYLALMIDSGRI